MVLPTKTRDKLVHDAAAGARVGVLRTLTQLATWSNGIVTPPRDVNANAVATSIAADELRPDPIGTCPSMSRLAPFSGYPSSSQDRSDSADVVTPVFARRSCEADPD